MGVGEHTPSAPAWNLRTTQEAAVCWRRSLAGATRGLGTRGGEALEGCSPAGLSLQWYAMTMWLQDDSSPVRTGKEMVCVCVPLNQCVSQMQGCGEGGPSPPWAAFENKKKKTLLPKLNQPGQLEEDPD